MARKLSKPSLLKQSFFKVLLGDFYQHLDVEAAKRRNGNPVSSVKDEIVDIETENYNKERTSRKYVMSGKRPANDVEETSTGSILFESENSCFVKTLTKKLYPVTIPKERAIAEGLVRKKTVKLQDPAGRSWINKGLKVYMTWLNKDEKNRGALASNRRLFCVSPADKTYPQKLATQKTHA
ncbi:unnamed protein product [Prunus armeniaca]|uniref:TF-B3 domain-containing protein n=1 Tax=Prunus armeniaca TaxID=36596 RepID=A0A6J5UNS5_PRUAR|nr:unnamed protein product [Prunus armeniaca]